LIKEKEKIYGINSGHETSPVTIQDAEGETILSYGVWHEKSCPVRFSGSVMKTCICSKPQNPDLINEAKEEVENPTKPNV